MPDTPTDAEALAAIMEQAQVFASAWSLVGGRFDDGTGHDAAIAEKEELRRMLRTLSAERDSLRADFAALQHALVGDTGASAILRAASLRAERRAADEIIAALRARVAALEAERAGLASRKDGAYLERNQVVAALAKCFPSGVALTAIDGWSEDWHGCVYIDLPTGQVSWHFHDSQAYLFDGLPAYGGTWDGHDTPEKYRRVAALRAERAAVVPEIDYFALIAAATARVKGAQGTPRCVAFKAGAEWFREQVLAAAPTPTPGDAP